MIKSYKGLSKGHSLQNQTQKLPNLLPDDRTIVSSKANNNNMFHKYINVMKFFSQESIH